MVYTELKKNSMCLCIEDHDWKLSKNAGEEREKHMTNHRAILMECYKHRCLQWTELS